MALPRKNIELTPIPSQNVSDFKDLYTQNGENLSEAFAYFLDKMIIPSSPDFPSGNRQEIIEFYSQVMNCFAHPGSPEIINVVKQLADDISSNMPKGYNKDLSYLKNCQYGENEYKLWPITDTKLLDPLNLDHCMAKVLIKSLQSIGFNKEDDANHYSVPQLLGVIPSEVVEDLLSKGVWFKEFSALPEGDTSTHGSWSHFLQIYFIIQLVNNGVIKLPGQMTLPELLKACVISLNEPTNTLRNIFDLVFEQREQDDVIEALIEKEQIMNLRNASPFNFFYSKINDQPMPTQLDPLSNQFTYSYFSLCSPAFLSSYLGVIHRYVEEDLSSLTMLWLHKLTKLNFNSIARKLPDDVNQHKLEEDPEAVLAILNSNQFFFNEAPYQPDLSKVDRSKFDSSTFLDEENQRGIFYRKK